ncbi:MAG: type IX secretion system membrane protein PorP/SprF [Bacteroidales bacterium]|nr:type IX secretion system membrane protein PorP/SprF [Bacteroidales bacterium]
MKFKLHINRGLVILILILATNASFAQQDPMYTQYFFNTQTINPAYTGTWESMGFMALARQQWASWDGAPETYTFSFQSPLKNEKVALGFNVISDKLGFEKRFGVFADYSYMVRLGETAKLRMGLKGGFTNYSNNLVEYTLYPGVNDPFFQGEIDNKFRPNFGVGLFLNGQKYYLGVSSPKLLQNNFESNYNNYSVQAEMMHYFISGGLVFDLGENIKFKPTFLTKAAWNAPVQVDLTANFLFREKLWLGGSYRTNDAIGLIAQWIFNNKLRIGYAYDYSITKLQNYHNGTHEIMISYEMRFLKEFVVSPRYF